MVRDQKGILIQTTNYLLKMQYAIIELGGRQFWIEKGRFIDINYINFPVGSKMFLKQILFAKNNTDLFIGRPYISQISVEAVVGMPLFGPKVIVYKMKPKKKYRRKTGHRQIFSRIFIENIIFN